MRHGQVDASARRRAGLASWIAVAIVFGVLHGMSRVPGSADEPKLPADLTVVPPEAVGFVTLRLSDLWNHPAAAAVKANVEKEGLDAIKEFVAGVGVEPAAVERATVYLRAFEGDFAPGLIFTTRAPYDRKKVLAAFGPSPREERRKGRSYFTDNRSRRALYLIDDRSFVEGLVSEIEAMIDRGPDGNAGALMPALHLASTSHTMVAGVNLAEVKRSFGDQLPAELESLRPLLSARMGALVIDAGEQIFADIQWRFTDDPSAKAGEKASRAALSMARELVGAQALALEKQRTFAATGEFLKRLTIALEKAKIQTSDKEVSLALRMPTDNRQLSQTVLDGLKHVRQSERRSRGINRLKQIALAMHNYHDATGSFPPAAIFDKDGKPLLSWRVLLLPFLDANELHKEFHLYEAWDSEHNKKLLARMPSVFKAEVANARPYETFYLGFKGKGAFFEGKKGTKIADITDGTSLTLMVVEAADSVPWSKPDDLPFDPAKPLPKLGFREEGSSAAYCDGSVRLVPRSTSEQKLKALITRNGGEVIDNSN
jgi:hypothetical protein